jgi:large subunit ribosomal protein L21
MFAILFWKAHIMYAIVEIAGKQYRVEENKYLYTDLLQSEEGAKIEFENILLVDHEDGNITVGEPSVKGAKVTGKVIEHVKGDTVIVFKKKRRKGYKKRNGHRQRYTKVLIENIK